MVSIIVPTYNRAALISYTLNSLKAELHPDVALEVIVVDDASTDDTVNLLSQQYPWVKLLSNKGKGAPSARNMGLAVAKGEFVLFLDSDDLIGPGYLAKKLEYLIANPDVGMCYGDYEYFSSGDGNYASNISFKHKYPLKADKGNEQAHLAHYLYGTYLPSNTFLWRTTAVKAIHGYDEKLIVNQDVELFIKAVINNVKIAYVADDTKVYVRNHEMGERVGAANTEKKLRAVFDLRKQLVADIEAKGCLDVNGKKALSRFMFSSWQKNRHDHPTLSKEFLQFAKSLYWPVQLNGNGPFAMLGKIIGPQRAVELKYFILKRD